MNDCSSSLFWILYSITPFHRPPTWALPIILSPYFRWLTSPGCHLSHFMPFVIPAGTTVRTECPGFSSFLVFRTLNMEPHGCILRCWDVSWVSQVQGDKINLSHLKCVWNQKANKSMVYNIKLSWAWLSSFWKGWVTDWGMSRNLTSGLDGQSRHPAKQRA